MIRSMTGYGRAEAAGARTRPSPSSARSVNHRHLDVVPQAAAGRWRAFEADARRLIQAAVQRGRVDVSATFTAPEGSALNPLTVNLAQAREYAAAARTLAAALDLGRRPIARLGAAASRACCHARSEAPLSRRGGVAAARAGRSARALDRAGRRAARPRASALAPGAARPARRRSAAHVDTMAARAPTAVERRRRRGCASGCRPCWARRRVDEARLATEVAVWADKTDITEELARLRAHLAELGAAARRGRPGGSHARLPPPGDQPRGEHGRLQGRRPRDLARR